MSIVSLVVLAAFVTFVFVAHVSSSCPSLAQRGIPIDIHFSLYYTCIVVQLLSFLLKPSTCLFISVRKRFVAVIFK